LEVGDDRYASRYKQNITQLDVLSLEKYNDSITLIGDLSTGVGLTENTYDCFICTQVLQFIFDVQSAVEWCVRVLKPHGTLLLTVVGTSKISRYEYDRCGEYWRFTDQGVRKLFVQKKELYSTCDVQAYGNFYSCTSFLDGLPIEQCDKKLLMENDLEYQMVITAEVTK